MKPLREKGADLITTFSILTAFAFSALVAKTQNVSGDTIHVNEKVIVELMFKAPSSAAIPGGDGSYNINGGTNTSLLVSAKKKGAKPQAMMVKEGGREHKFVLLYQDNAASKRINYANLDELAARDQKKLSLTGTKDSFSLPFNPDKPKKGIKPDKDEKKWIQNQLKTGHELYTKQLWREAWEAYVKVEPFDFKERPLVHDRLIEIAAIKKEEAAQRKLKFDDAMREADGFIAANEFIKAEASLQLALALFPDHEEAQKRMSEVRPKADVQRKKEKEILVISLIKQADQAIKAKKYLEADRLLEIALSHDPDNKEAAKMKGGISSQVKNARIHLLISEADSLFKAKSFAAAGAVYQKALSLRKGDPYVLRQLKKVEQKIELAQKRSNYLQAIANGDKAFGNQDLDKASSEYQRALRIFPDSTYPVQQIAAINQLRKGATVTAPAEKDPKNKSTAGKGN